MLVEPQRYRLVARPGGDAGPMTSSAGLFQKVRDAGIAPSIGAVGSCFDNAMVEAFWARMQAG
jgi:putative transposase